ncbi:MAG: serine acetyltransferase [Frankia sp.]|nr:serine acetyltransferase [Frankia sp.]
MWAERARLDPDGLATPAPLWVLLREDWVAHGRSWVHPGFHALAIHRIGHACLGRPAWQRVPLTVLYKLLNELLVRNVYGVELADEAIIGRRVVLGHHQSLQIPAFCVLGDDTLLRHNVTIGFARVGDPREHVPRIGRRVHIGPGAHLLGPITIGDDAVIGPNAIVTTDLPAGATAFAPPARVMKPAPARPPDVPAPAEPAQQAQYLGRA